MHRIYRRAVFDSRSAWTCRLVLNILFVARKILGLPSSAEGTRCQGTRNNEAANGVIVPTR